MVNRKKKKSLEWSQSTDIILGQYDCYVFRKKNKQNHVKKMERKNAKRKEKERKVKINVQKVCESVYSGRAKSYGKRDIMKLSTQKCKSIQRLLINIYTFCTPHIFVPRKEHRFTLSLAVKTIVNKFSNRFIVAMQCNAIKWYFVYIS